MIGLLIWCYACGKSWTSLALNGATVDSVREATLYHGNGRSPCCGAFTDALRITGAEVTTE